MKRRLTIFPGTSNPYFIKKRIKINLFALFTPLTFFFFISETPVPTYNRRFILYSKIPVNVFLVNQNSFKRPKVKRNFAQKKDPWLIYYIILTEDQAKPVILIYR